MTGCLNSFKEKALRVYDSLPSAIQICNFAKQEDAVDRIIKMGRLGCYAAYATCVTIGSSAVTACAWSNFGNMWAASRLPGIVGLFGVSTLPATYLVLKDTVDFVKRMCWGVYEIPTGFIVNHTNVTYCLKAVGKFEKTLVLMSKGFLTFALTCFAYATYVGIPVGFYHEFFEQEQSASDAVFGIYYSVLPVLSAAFAAFAVSSFARWAYNRHAISRLRKMGIETWEDEVQYRYDQRRLTVDVFARLLESAEFSLILHGFSGFPKPTKCSLGSTYSGTTMAPSTVSSSTLSPGTSGEVIRWEDWMTFVMGSVGGALALVKVWMDVSPPKFTPPAQPLVNPVIRV